MIGTCLAEEAHTPELLQLLRSRTVLPRRELLLEVVAAARERDELREGVDPEVVVSALLGTFYADYLAGRFAVDEPGAPAGPRPASTWSSPAPCAEEAARRLRRPRCAGVPGASGGGALAPPGQQPAVAPGVLLQLGVGHHPDTLQHQGVDQLETRTGARSPRGGAAAPAS